MSDTAAAGAENQPGDRREGRRFTRRGLVSCAVAALALVVGLAVLLHILNHGNGFSWVSADHPSASYWAVFLLVFGDAICPILPGETTLNAASTLAAQGTLELGPVILAGALWAIVGDSTLYWIARRSSERVQPQLERAKKDKRVVAALAFIGDSAALLLIAGRFVPGMRFVINVTMGLSAYSYRRFLLYSAIGGSVWAAYTCLLAYAVGTALAEFPLASVIISGAISTIALGALFLVIRRRRRAPQPAASVDEPVATA